MAITPYYLSLINLDDPNDPVRKQAIPTIRELHNVEADLKDLCTRIRIRPVYV